jgi:hypothetical protein
MIKLDMPTPRLAKSLALGLCIVGASATAAPPEGFNNLFNGKDLKGWHGHNPHDSVKVPAEGRKDAIASYQAAFNEHWSAENGELVNDGHGPYATTNKAYGDVEFHVEYRTVPLADSGIYMRGTPQIQIWDSTEEAKFKLGGNLGSGGLWNNSPGTAGKDPSALMDKPFGEWNSFKITQIGARTSVILNNKLVVDNAIMENYWDRSTPLPASAPIHLQTHGGEIRWRNIFIREFSAEEANAKLRGDDAAQGFKSLFNGKDLSGWQGSVENYEVRDGTVACKEGHGGTLYTKEEYGDFVVRVEFKLPPGGNNGLAIRYPGKGNAAFDGMTELQVLDDTAEKYKELDERQYHGSAYGKIPVHRGFQRPVGEWNYQEVTVVGSTIKVELNGSVILNGDVGKVTEFMGEQAHPGKDLKKGYFGFAGHNDPVQFRNIAIKKL